MKMIFQLTVIVCLLFSFAVSAARESSQPLKVASRDQAIQLVKNQYQGKVLKAQTTTVNGHSGYKIKLISNQGLVFYVSVNAQTGRISRN